MTNISKRLKRLETFQHAGNKIWYAEAVEGAADEWKLKLMLTESGRVIEKKSDYLTFYELMQFKQQSDIGVLIDIASGLV